MLKNPNLQRNENTNIDMKNSTNIFKKNMQYSSPINLLNSSSLNKKFDVVNYQQQQPSELFENEEDNYYDENNFAENNTILAKPSASIQTKNTFSILLANHAWKYLYDLMTFAYTKTNEKKKTLTKSTASVTAITDQNQNYLYSEVFDKILDLNPSNKILSMILNKINNLEPYYMPTLKYSASELYFDELYDSSYNMILSSSILNLSEFFITYLKNISNQPFPKSSLIFDSRQIENRMFISNIALEITLSNALTNKVSYIKNQNQNYPTASYNHYQPQTQPQQQFQTQQQFQPQPINNLNNLPNINEKLPSFNNIKLSSSLLGNNNYDINNDNDIDDNDSKFFFKKNDKNEILKKKEEEKEENLKKQENEKIATAAILESSSSTTKSKHESMLKNLMSKLEEFVINVNDKIDNISNENKNLKDQLNKIQVVTTTTPIQQKIVVPPTNVNKLQPIVNNNNNSIANNNKSINKTNEYENLKKNLDSSMAFIKKDKTDINKLYHDLNNSSTTKNKFLKKSESENSNKSKHYDTNSSNSSEEKNEDVNTDTDTDTDTNTYLNHKKYKKNATTDLDEKQKKHHHRRHHHKIKPVEEKNNIKHSLPVLKSKNPLSLSKFNFPDYSSENKQN